MTLYKLKLNRNDLKEDRPTGAEAQGKKLALVLHKGKVYALNAVCTHMGGPLDEGKIEGDEIVCPLHSGRFYIATGKADHSTRWVHDTETYKIVENKSTRELSVEL